MKEMSEKPTPHQPLQEEQLAETPESLSAPVPTASNNLTVTSATEAPDEAGDDVVHRIASQIGEEAATLTKRADMGAVLKKMQEGVVIQLHISRPRFWRTFSLEELGLSMSEAAKSVVDAYFQLGKRSLLPPELQKQLASVEAAARYNLQQHAIKSHWGAFVPRTAYKEWKEENERLEQAFWELREKVVTNYALITMQVIEDARPLAEDAWKRVMVGAALLRHDEDAVTHDTVMELVDALRAGRGKETFIENYLLVIREAIPEKEAIGNAFRYEVERSVVPLPSLVARDMEDADRIYRERALEDARTRAALEAIEAQRRAEAEHLSWQQRPQREAEYERLRNARELQRLQWEMEHDVLNDARKQKERLVREFYNGIVAQINTLILEVTSNVLESLDNHQGVIRGRVSLQLHNLVKQLEQLNFVENEQIEDQLQRLRLVLPSAEEREKAAKGTARIDTTRIESCVRAIHKEVQNIQVDLSAQPQLRSHRGQGLFTEPVTLDAPRRKVRDKGRSNTPDPAQTAGSSRGRRKRTL